MGICPNCGSWIDEGDICNCCGGSGYYCPDDELENTPNFVIELPKATELVENERYHEALDIVDKYLEYDMHAHQFWNLKGIIMKNIADDDSDTRFAQSVECYRKALKEKDICLYRNNMSITFSDWAWYLIDRRNYVVALEKANEAIEFACEDADLAYAFNVKAVVYNRYGARELAMKFYDLALEYDPENEVYKENKTNFYKAVDYKYGSGH